MRSAQISVEDEVLPQERSGRLWTSMLLKGSSGGVQASG